MFTIVTCAFFFLSHLALLCKLAEDGSQHYCLAGRHLNIMGKHPFKIDAVSQNIKSHTATWILSYNPNAAVKAARWTVSAVQGVLVPPREK